MISRKLWVTIRRQKSRHGHYGKSEQWEVEREGWFLFGFIPLYSRDVRISER